MSNEDIRQLQRRIQDLGARCERAEMRARQTWVSNPIFNIDAVWLLACGGGNTVYTYGATNYYGLISGFNITSLPTATPSGTPLGTNPSGLTWAYLYDANGNTTTVWMALRANGSTDLNGAIVQGTPIVSRRSVQVLVSGSTYGTVYLPYQLG